MNATICRFCGFDNDPEDVEKGICGICLLQGFTPLPCIPPQVDEAFLIVMVGRPGSGKSTLSENLLGAFGGDRAVICCQDVLKTRKKVERAAEDAISRGQIAIIDRLNFDKEQRMFWYNLAEKLGVNVDIVHFDIAKDICIRRCDMREGHPTIKAGTGKRFVSMVRVKKPTERESTTIRSIFEVRDDASIFTVVKHYRDALTEEVVHSET